MKSGEGKVQVLAWVGQKMYFTSQSREDLLGVNVALLGRSSCRPEGDTGQKVSLVQKLVWGAVRVSISISLGSCSRRLMSLVAISCLSSVNSHVSTGKRRHACQIGRQDGAPSKSFVKD